MVLSSDADEVSIFSASAGAAGTRARATFVSAFRAALSGHLHISEYRVLITSVRAGSLLVGVTILDTPTSVAAIEPTADDCEATLAAQLAASTGSLQIGRFTAAGLASLAPPSPTTASDSLSAGGDGGALPVAVLIGASAAGVALLLLLGLTLLCRGRARGTKARGTPAPGKDPGLPSCTIARELEPGSPTVRPRAPSRLDALAMALASHAGLASKAAAKARQRDNGIAHGVDEERGGGAGPTSMSPPPSRSPKPGKPSLKRATDLGERATFVPQLGWMSAAAARKLETKRGTKRSKQHAADMARAHGLYSSSLASSAV